MAPLNTAQLAGAPYQIPPEPSRLPSALMALLVHGVLLGFLWFGINWQDTEPTAVEAEVWDMESKQAAAPLLPQPEPEPEPQPRPEPPPPPPTPAPKVIEPPAPPKTVEPPPVQKTPDIALERQKEQKKKLLEKRLADEKLLAEKKKELAELKQKQLAEVKQKALAELKEKQLEDKKANDLAAKKDKEKADKLAKAAKAAQELAETKRSEKLREAEMARIANAAGSSGGSAAKSTSPNLDNSYKAAINAKIKGNTSFAGSGAITGNPYVSFEIQQLPTGEIISVRKVKSSGVDAFDNAVERGINNSSPLPKRKDGTVERTLTVGYRLNDID